MPKQPHIPNWPYCDSSSPNALTGERDACGVGFLAQIEGNSNHWVLEQALRGLECMEHRGGCGGDSDSGDGAGLLCEIPWSFLESIWSEIKSRNNSQKLGLGMLFMPNNLEECTKAKNIFEKEAKTLGLTSRGWREVPVNPSVLGPLAKETAPFILQWLVEGNDQEENFESLLFRLRKRIQNQCANSFKEIDKQPYIASLSSRTVVYKGMVRSEVLADFYQDLRHKEFKISFAIYHRRFSTNTLPRWPLAQPMRLLGHNGEINTLLGNLNWAKATEVHLEEIWGESAKDLTPVVNSSFSDSANLDATLELLVRSGRPITDSLLTLVPEAFRDQPELEEQEEINAFYEYSACTQEAWDGPALLVFSDGHFIGATLDRNGLRPARYCVTKDNLVIMGSETGVVDIEDSQIIEKGRLGPGQMLAVDLQKGRLLKNWEVKKEAANRHPYQSWLSANRVIFKNQPWVEKTNLEQLDLLQKQTAFGFSAEDFDLIINTMASEGKEPTYCMGNDIPLAILSNKAHILYDYFKQRFAQVTNPPIDPLREKLVMSLEMHLGKKGSPLSPQKDGFSVISLNSPIINENDLIKLCSQGLSTKIISTLISIEEGLIGLEKVLKDICNDAELAVRNGTRVLILSDRGLNQSKTYIPPLLAVGAVHHHLLKHKLRLDVSIIIDTAQCWSTHHVACLIGYGASAICPWLAWETTRHWWKSPKTQKLIESQNLANLTIQTAQANLKKALEDGLRKILSKIGISLLASYNGAQIFEAVGIGADIIDIAFKGTTSRISGLTLKELANETLSFHSKAFPNIDLKKLEFFGFVQFRSGGEFHLNNPAMSKALHSAVRQGSNYDHFSTYQSLLESRPATSLRDLLTFKKAKKPLPIEQVESVENICKRFCTGGMSLGALSREAHEVLAIAMNRIGGKSNSGEGGEDPQRFKILTDVDEQNLSASFPNLKGLKNGDSACSAIKQIASGRFGVTPEYLRSGKQLEIKVAQGAKPGEGGQLPGKKVDTYIAKLRNSKAGVALISPPPHHDIYSIEDLAQLIHDLHQIHPKAKVSVKLVAEIGIGTIAAGVAKANADVIQISGHDGGTGASPLSSITHAGLPWELGLTEVHRVLLENGLRNRVLLRADGGLKTGWDVVMAALLGAEEYGFGSIAMIAEGCIMARICHTNKCPVGVATQQEALRKRFSGVPEHVVNFFLFVAEEVRQIMSLLGASTLEEIIGNTEMLQSRNVKLAKTKEVDLSSLLKPIPKVQDRSWLVHQIEPHSNGNVLENALLKDSEICNAIINHGNVSRIIPIANTDRSVCARISGEIAKEHGNKGFKGTLDLTFKGASGQSFGAFLLQGMNVRLIGEANDYVGKGINGGAITLIPPTINENASNQVILGNTCLYGGTGGKLFALGKAGERFAVRNSGVETVVEGAGDHCCEYMTGGIVVVLGETGRNVGAGMTGGITFLLNEDNQVNNRVNTEIVEIHSLLTTEQEDIVKPLIKEHYQKTKSFKAQKIINEWAYYKQKFKILVPPSEKLRLGLLDQ
ncbi:MULTISPECIES: glutamate synthase large subunit [Prochlorococcus]|uniref:glutamate synthase (ferredoxin) n=1 Tax=Prochlorococcus marinus (strain SARG / CCMP1375 / SS120) TaxID=167539 RepID=Q7VA01_PROMA|nr:MULTISPECIES: glutamate synthase large subunit [Prochlorococcus]AAQ00712.1 Ferredoxin-dependent glutamate synthase [Prochlorococcus marinus subsp. marinus str. CCMP1375]KGG10791.1 Ferredoxin-dependent glutamate synthase [Prochlorococcus marinus str. LG]KGG20139.1 Ferredoxin-dependent glutamate synthase [Prochlorococcus marinus str. SS2]KGG24039.1 Ferredoxin-dependent glutamate synthase [Prochlorococcus marinus str. SS35]KGG31702.1 Ferredoxin-dependent glutamate synthase [Prochlorococcus mar